MEKHHYFLHTPFIPIDIITSGPQGYSYSEPINKEKEISNRPSNLGRILQRFI